MDLLCRYSRCTLNDRKHITPTWLERTKLKDGEVKWRGDPACQGLRARISQGAKQGRAMGWYYRYKSRTTGKLVAPFVIGQYPLMSLEGARAVVNAELRPLASSGKDVKREWERLQTAEDIKAIRHLIPEYLAYSKRAGLADGTLRLYRRALRPLAHWWGDKYPREITRGDAQDLFHRVRSEGVPPYDIDGAEIKRGKATGGSRAAGHTKSAASAFWTYLVDRDLADYNPWAGQKKLSQIGQSGTAERALSDAEIKQVLESDTLSLQDATIVRFMLATGLRPTECLEASWTEMDLEAGVWTIPKHRMKHKRAPHTVALSDYLIDVLNAWRKTQRGRPRYLFPAQSDKNPTVDTTNLGRRLHDKLGIQGFTPKVCRATFRTGLVAMGCPSEVRDYMSHHHTATRLQKSYEHHDHAPEAAKWWQKWGQHLEGSL